MIGVPKLMICTNRKPCICKWMERRGGDWCEKFDMGREIDMHVTDLRMIDAAAEKWKERLENF